jgi:hypothetical protein
MAGTRGTAGQRWWRRAPARTQTVMVLRSGRTRLVVSLSGRQPFAETWHHRASGASRAATAAAAAPEPHLAAPVPSPIHWPLGPLPCRRCTLASRTLTEAPLTRRGWSLGYLQPSARLPPVQPTGRHDEWRPEPVADARRTAHCQSRRGPRSSLAPRRAPTTIPRRPQRPRRSAAARASIISISSNSSSSTITAPAAPRPRPRLLVLVRR